MLVTLQVSLFSEPLLLFLWVSLFLPGENLGLNSEGVATEHSLLSRLHSASNLKYPAQGS